MASLNIQKLKKRLSEKVRNRKLVKLGETMREVGYSDTYSLQPSRVMKNNSMNTLVEELESEIVRIQRELKTKDLSEVQYESLTRAMDIQIRNKQLLSGGATENTKITIEVSEAIAKKNQARLDSKNDIKEL